MTINEKYKQACETPSDINELMPHLRRYAEQCDKIVELGVRSVVGTWAFLSARPKKLTSYDIHQTDEVFECIRLCAKEGLDWDFIEADVLKVKIPYCDLIFFDTLHIASQLRQELKLHAWKAKKWLIFHDTETYWTNPEPTDWQTPAIMANYVQGDTGIGPAIEEFLAENPHWIVKERFTNNNGLLILENTKATRSRPKKSK